VLLYAMEVMLEQNKKIHHVKQHCENVFLAFEVYINFLTAGKHSPRQPKPEPIHSYNFRANK
jgi:hypothetical protein